MNSLSKIFLVLHISFCIFSQSFGQANNIYIAGQLADIEKLISKGDFIEGAIFLNNNTLNTKILNYKGKRKKNYYLFCISSFSSDSILIFKPGEVSGYRIGETNYISHVSGMDTIFLKQIRSGRVQLFEKSSTPSNFHSLYYLKFPRDTILYVVNPQQQNVIKHQFDRGRPTPPGTKSTFYQVNQIPQKFKIFIGTHMGNCTEVTSRVNSGFYTINDIPRIVDTYNKCFD